MNSLAARPVKPRDFPQITAIANHYISHSVCTFRLDLVTQSTLFETYESVRAQSMPYIVVVDGCNQESDTVLGYAYATGYKIPSHQGYCHTVEISAFAHPDARGKGVGSLLMDTLMGALKSPEDWPEYMAPIQDKPAAPIITEVLSVMAVDPTGVNEGYGLRDWYARWGFVEVGKLKNVGHKFGMWLDVLFLQASFNSDKVGRI